MSDATATILQPYGKPYEFSLLDRKVVVCTENDVDEQNDPSLYSLIRAWVRNGYIPARKPETEASPPFSLPPSQPDTKEKLEYPDECFTNFYVKDDSDTSNLASVYKSAWVTTHSTYTAFKAKRRRRHATRHSALLAVAQQNQKNRLAQPPKPPPAAVPPPADATAEPPIVRPVPLPLPSATTTYAQVPRPAAEDLLRSHNLTMRTGSTPLANTPQPLEKRPGTIVPRQSPGSFTVGYIAADNVRQAHNLAERGSTVPVTSASPAATNVDSQRSSHAVCGPVNLADMQLRSAHQGASAEMPAPEATVGGMPRGGSPSSMSFARSKHPQAGSLRPQQPTKAQLQAHIHAQAQAQVRAQLQAAQAAAAAAEQGDAGAGASAAARGPLSSAKLAGPIAGRAAAAGQGAGPPPLRDRWRGRDLGLQFGAMSGTAPAAGTSNGSLGSGGSDGK